MHDEQRAEMLFRALAEGDAPPEIADDEELAALVELGADLQRHGPELALFAQAEAAFDPAFASRLRRTLVAVHPATPAEGVAVVGSGQEAAPRGLRRRGLLRALLALAVLAMAATALVIFSVLQNLQPGFQTSTAAPTVTTGPAHGATGAQLSHGAQRTAKAAVVPRPAQSDRVATPGPAASATAGPRTPSPVFGPNQGAAPLTTAPASPPGGSSRPQTFSSMDLQGGLVYSLTARLPTAPARVPLYSLAPAPLSDREVATIVASFPGVRVQIAARTMRVYTAGRQRLVLLPGAGQVDYTNGSLPPSGGKRLGAAPAPETAILTAHTWLEAHGLYPKGVGDNATTVQQIGAITSVRFAPATALPLSGADGALSLIVDLDEMGRVVSAHRIWPSVQRSGTVSLVPPTQAVRSPAPAGAASTATNGSGPADRVTHTFTVTGVALAYAPYGAELRPVYVLTGTVRGAGVAQHAYTQTVRADGAR